MVADIAGTLAGRTGKLTLVTNPADLFRQAVASVEADLIGQSPESAPISKHLSLHNCRQLLRKL
jgi:hypothetical protein